MNEPELINGSWEQTIAYLLSGDAPGDLEPVNGSWKQTIAYLIYNLSGGTGDNYFTTQATLSGSTIIFDRNDLPAAYSVDIASAVGSGVVVNLDAGTAFSILMSPNYDCGFYNSIAVDDIDGGGINI